MPLPQHVKEKAKAAVRHTREGFIEEHIYKIAKRGMDYDEDDLPLHPNPMHGAKPKNPTQVVRAAKLLLQDATYLALEQGADEDQKYAYIRTRAEGMGVAPSDVLFVTQALNSSDFYYKQTPEYLLSPPKPKAKLASPCPGLLR